MKSMIVSAILFLTSAQVFASCPDLSGTYEYDNGYGPEHIVFVQDECKTIKRELYWLMSGGKRLIQERTLDLSGNAQPDPEYPSLSTQTYFDNDVLVYETESRVTRFWLDQQGNLQIVAGYIDASGSFVTSLTRVGIRK